MMGKSRWLAARADFCQFDQTSPLIKQASLWPSLSEAIKSYLHTQTLTSLC